MAGCPQENIDELELDHPNGDGNKDRAEKLGLGLRSPGGHNFYARLKALGWPPGYAVICIDHHDQKHGRTAKENRHHSAPGMDDTRIGDTVPAQEV